MTPSTTAKNVLWLDPFQALPKTTAAQLGALGLVVRTVSTLDELNAFLGWAHALVVRLVDTHQLFLDLQNLLLERQCALPIICRIHRRQFELAITVMRQGALHVVPCDEWTLPVWQQVKQAMVAAHQPQGGNSEKGALNAPSYASPVARSVVYVDPTSRHLLALAQRVAQTQVAVLLQGPTGAGKEVLARVVHESSPRARGPFVALNCAAMPEQLIEDMLFGHEKGAFTGAVKEHHGAFEQAHGGTLFLDEIAEMPVHLQAKLLRALQERQIVRLGAERALSVDVRLVAATNKDLRQAMVEREFREDLYFRISTFKLTVPPLRDRQGDILPLVAQLLVRHGQSGRVLHISQEAQTALQNYAWPGNVRELENVILRALVLCSGDTIMPAHLMFDDAAVTEMWLDAPQEAQMPAAMTFPVNSGLSLAAGSEDGDATLQEGVKNSELQIIMAAIKATDSRNEAAKKLGISPRTLRYKLAKLKENGHEVALH